MANIIFADDEPNNRLVIGMHLELRGHAPRLADDGVEALRMAHEQEPDLFILDLMMPGLNGVETCACLRSDPTLARLPVILLTAMDRVDALRQAARTRFDAIVTKPFRVEELLREIDRLSSPEPVPA